jgi:lipopolysaccharide biosynthesis glycosyltransferase
MKIFLDDFTVYSETESNLMKLKLCFQKCKEYKSSLNLDKCAFMVFSRLILRSIVSKEGKILYLKKVHAIMNMLVFINP